MGTPTSAFRVENEEPHRYGRSRTTDFPMIAAGLLALPVDQVLLDGEGLAHCAAGLPDFNRTLLDEAHQHGLFQDPFEVPAHVALAIVITIILGMIAATGWAMYAFRN